MVAKKKPEKFVIALAGFLSPGRQVHKGDLFAADDPIIKGRESMFKAVEEVVEQATAAPGELRATKPKAEKEKV